MSSSSSGQCVYIHKVDNSYCSFKNTFKEKFTNIYLKDCFIDSLEFKMKVCIYAWFKNHNSNQAHWYLIYIYIFKRVPNVLV